jgi:hypothetical protein
MYLIIAKYAAILVLTLGMGYLGYNKIYTIGYSNASEKYEQRIKDYTEALTQRISVLELHSSVIIEQSNKTRAETAKEYANILRQTKNKPLVIFQNGVCQISPEFSKAYIDALSRANKK